MVCGASLQLVGVGGQTQSRVHQSRVMGQHQTTALRVRAHHLQIRTKLSERATRRIGDGLTHGHTVRTDHLQTRTETVRTDQETDWEQMIQSRGLPDGTGPHGQIGPTKRNELT